MAMHEIIIKNYHPPRLNELMHGHWSSGAKLKKQCTHMIAAYSRHIPKAACKRKVELLMQMAPRQRCADVDAYWKSVLDSLVKCGILVDDHPKHCEIMPVVYGRGEFKQTIIRLYDCTN